MKYIVGMDEFTFRSAVDKDHYPLEAKHVGDDAPPKVIAAPASRNGHQFVEMTTVCLEIPHSAMRCWPHNVLPNERDKCSPRHLLMTAFEARQMASLLVAAGEASLRGESFDSETIAKDESQEAASQKV